jgi:hypothetical protein
MVFLTASGVTHLRFGAHIGSFRGTRRHPSDTKHRPFVADGSSLCGSRGCSNFGPHDDRTIGAQQRARSNCDGALVDQRE